MNTIHVLPRVSRGLFAATLVTLMALIGYQPRLVASDGNEGNPVVLPSHASPNGHSYGEWAALWWQWALGIPAEINPLFDETGENASVGQSGSVWFLAGNFGGTTVREATIPAGKKLFFPVINNFWVTTCLGEPRTQDDIRPLIAPFIDDATGLGAEVDGVQVENIDRYRAESPLFCTPLTIFGIETAEDLEAAGFCAPGESDPDCADLPNPEEHFGSTDGFGPGMADGYWVMLEPLRVGEHVIHFEAASGDFALDVTYVLEVVPAAP